MRFFFHYPEPQYPEPGGTDAAVLSAGPLREVATAVERAGFDGLSLSEHPAPGARWSGSGGHQTLDPFVALSFVAAVTSRLRLLTYLAVAPYRNPLLLAKAAATLDLVSDGRVTLGLGAGYQKSEFHALGVDFEERNQLFDEVLDTLPLHWHGSAFSYEGKHFSARDVIARPRPTQGRIPIWIGGNSALSRRRVAERAQGWMPMSGDSQLSTTARTPALGSIDQLAHRISELRAAAAAAGRDEPIDVVYSYGQGIDVPLHEPDRHRESFARLAEAGVTWIVVSGRADSTAATVDFVESFGATYLAGR
ncbi:LLM class F420-dependent oxidoreductase [Nocardia fluminea]|uniref:LLM class F420-dependent oxidoreductase n=1 Tax=Nocardia fluminea TaxID=134984 RepID=UPI0033DED6DC